MQITKVITTVVATACAATAAPHGNGHDGGDGNNNGNVNCQQGDLVCCQTTANLVGVGCVLNNLLLSPCTQNQVCCSNVGSGNQECKQENSVISIPIHILGA